MENQNIEEILKKINNNEILARMKRSVNLIDRDLNEGKLKLKKKEESTDIDFDIDFDIDNEIAFAEHKYDMYNQFSIKDQINLDKLKAINNFYKIFKKNGEIIKNIEEKQVDLSQSIQAVTAVIKRTLNDIEERKKDLEDAKNKGAKADEIERLEKIIQDKQETVLLNDSFRKNLENEYAAYDKFWKDLYEGAYKDKAFPENLMKKKDPEPSINGDSINEVSGTSGNNPNRENGNTRRVGTTQGENVAKTNNSPNSEQVVANTIQESVDDNKPKTAENSNDENTQENGDNENINETDANKDGTEQQTGKSDSEKPKTNQTEANDGKALFTTSINRFRTEITTADGKTYTLLTKEMKNVLKAYNKGNKDEMKKEIARISGLDVKDITPDLLDKVDPLILACVSKMENQEKGKENLAKEYLGKYLDALQKNEKDKDMKITYDLNTLSDFFGIKVKDKLKTYERALKSANVLDFKDEFKPAPMFRWLTGLRKNNVPKLPAGKPEPQAQPDPNTKPKTQGEPDNTRENTTPTVEPITIINQEGHENTEGITPEGDITNDGEENTVNNDSVVNGEDTKTQTQGKESGFRGRREVSEAVTNNNKPAGSKYNRDNKRRGKPSVGAQARNKEKNKNKVVETVSVNTELAIKNANKKAEQTTGQNEQENDGR